MLITASGQRRNPSDLVGLNDSDSDSDSSSSESSSDSEESESDEEVHEEGGRKSQEAQGETPASGISPSVAVEDPWRGPAFDNVLSFWRIA